MLTKRDLRRSAAAIAAGATIAKPSLLMAQSYAKGGVSLNGWQVNSFFGNPEFYNGDWLKRAAGAKVGIYGNDSVEAVYPLTRVDDDGQILDGSKRRQGSCRRSTPSGR